MKQGFRVIDAELHLVEPTDLWENGLAEPWRSQTNIHWAPQGDSVPPVRHFEFNGKLTPPLGEPTLARRNARRHFPERPQMARAHTYCTSELYLEGMDIEGIDVAVLTPTHVMPLVHYDDMRPEHAISICRAYNDWAASFARALPSRFKFLGFLPQQDAQMAADEAQRCVEELGAVGVMTTQGSLNGHLLGDPFFEPFWKEAERLDAPVGLHIVGAGGARDNFRARYAGHGNMEIVANALGSGGVYAPTAVAELILGGVLERHSELRIVIMESCVSWLPWLLWRLDEKWETFKEDVPQTLALMPSEYFKRQCYAVMEPEEVVAKYVIDYMGDANLLFSSDYPHHDSAFPEAVERFLALPDISDESKRKILWDNAARLFHFDAVDEASSGQSQRRVVETTAVRAGKD